MRRRKIKTEHQIRTRKLFIKGNHELRRFIFSLLGHTLGWTEGSVRQVSFVSISLVGLFGASSYEEASKSSQIESIYSTACHDRNSGRAAVWLSGYSERCGGG